MMTSANRTKAGISNKRTSSSKTDKVTRMQFTPAMRKKTNVQFKMNTSWKGVYPNLKIRRIYESITTTTLDVIQAGWLTNFLNSLEAPSIVIIIVTIVATLDPTITWSVPYVFLRNYLTTSSWFISILPPSLATCELSISMSRWLI
jgi:hypothetical protein